MRQTHLRQVDLNLLLALHALLEERHITRASRRCFLSRRLANIDARHAVQDTVTESPDRPIRPRNPTLVGEKHFTPQELAGAWGVSAETIRQIFREEQGVLKIGKSGTRTKRGYFTLRIPKEVAERVHRRLSA